MLVDAGREAVEIDIVIGLGDAPGEVAGDRRRHHFADADLQVGAFRLQRRFLGVQFAHLDAVALEHLDGPGHLADLVRPVGEGDLDREIAVGKRAHHLCCAVDWPRDANDCKGHGGETGKAGDAEQHEGREAGAGEIGGAICIALLRAGKIDVAEAVGEVIQFIIALTHGACQELPGLVFLAGA